MLFFLSFLFLLCFDFSVVFVYASMLSAYNY